MMDYDKLKKQVSKDFQFNEFNIKEISMRVTAIKHFWVCRLSDVRMEMMNLKKTKKAKISSMVNGIIASSPTKITISTARTQAEHSDIISELSDKIHECEFMERYLEEVVKIAHSFGWDIKNAVSLIELEQR